jgi:signal transduction histidine kinase
MTHDLRALILSKEMLLRDVSHELRSPLSRLRLAAGLARNGIGDRATAFVRIEREVERIDAMISQILSFSRVEPNDGAGFADFDASALVRECVEDARIEADQRRLTMRMVTEVRAVIHGNVDQVRAAIENVLRNAIRHAPDQSIITISSALTFGRLTIEIVDEGAGTGDSSPDWIFEPFRRGKGSDGVGLGLSITRRIVEFHGGRAIARNRESGFAVELSFPTVSRDNSAEQPSVLGR